ncbi:restriction endonuclease [Desulfatibacillum aliphaticivorans]|uniref:restriction endonuclease n=1 Tax=Desulfatibacillum aliphaticivorans TaxID=218208 RepID=UPI00047FE2B6|nr:AAA family ATPase [Desulfatibacillum aliphaticivorans]
MVMQLNGPDQFEELVFNILSCTNPLKIDWKQGGRDRGRDISLLYRYNNEIFSVTVECKFYSKPVNIAAISNSVNWAKVHRPDLLYFWVTPYLTPDTKDYLHKFTDNYNINIDYEDQANIRSYQSLIFHERSSIREQILPRLLSHFEKSIKQRLYSIEKTALEYESTISLSDHSLVDREDEIKLLKDVKCSSYYIHGISGVGKSQIAKNVAQHFFKSGRAVYWHSIIGEHDSDNQSKAFLSSLGDFFKINCDDGELHNYFNSYGFGLTNTLIHLLIELTARYHPIIFIDDVHKCRHENDVLITLLMRLINKCTCQFYLIGWYNIFSYSLLLRNKIRYIHINGLSTKHLKELIYQQTGTYPTPSSLSILGKYYGGLPLYAAFADRLSEGTENIDALPVPELVFQKYLSHLKADEIGVVKALALCRLPVSVKSFKKQKSLSPLESLCEKMIVNIAGSKCFLHDSIKLFAKNTFQGESIGETSLRILQNETKCNIAIAIDIINAYINSFEYNNALFVLDDYFERLMDGGLDLELIVVINNLLVEDCDFINLSIKKISLLERVGELKQARQLVEIVDSSIDTKNNDYCKWQYTKTRILYFNNQFESVVEESMKVIEKQVPISSEEGIQFLFLLGRC